MSPALLCPPTSHFFSLEATPGFLVCLSGSFHTHSIDMKSLFIFNRKCSRCEWGALYLAFR